MRAVVRLISWNLNGRREKTGAQVAAVLLRDPDVVALQEVTYSSLPILRGALAEGGLTQIVDSFALAPIDFRPQGARRYGQLTASRYPLGAQLPGRFPVPWPERILSAQLRVGGRQVEIHNAHVPPGSSNGWIKIAVLNGIFKGLAIKADNPRILCGDFNTPQAELATGEIVTWAQRLSRAQGWRIVRTRFGRAGSEWDACERQVLSGLAEFDLVDVYRSLHGYGPAEASWVLRRSSGNVGRRFDHVFASRTLRPLTCEYLHSLRLSGLSDHSPIEATFRFPE